MFVLGLSLVTLSIGNGMNVDVNVNVEIDSGVGERCQEWGKYCETTKDCCQTPAKLFCRYFLGRKRCAKKIEIDSILSRWLGFYNSCYYNTLWSVILYHNWRPLFNANEAAILAKRCGSTKVPFQIIAHYLRLEKVPWPKYGWILIHL